MWHYGRIYGRRAIDLQRDCALFSLGITTIVVYFVYLGTVEGVDRLLIRRKGFRRSRNVGFGSLGTSGIGGGRIARNRCLSACGSW